MVRGAHLVVAGGPPWPDRRGPGRARSAGGSRAQGRRAPTNPFRQSSVSLPAGKRRGCKSVAVPPVPVPTFIDDAESRGLSFIFDNGRSERRQLPETMSGGVAFLDFDGDGWLDIYAVQGGRLPPSEPRPALRRPLVSQPRRRSI